MLLIWLIILLRLKFFPWIFLCLVIITGIITYFKYSGKFKAHFFEKVSDNQLEKEILKAFNEILNLFDENQGYIYTHYKTQNHLVSKIDKYKVQLKSTKIDKLQLSTMYFTLKDPFIELSRKYNFQKSQRKIVDDLYLMLLEFEKRQNAILK